jgi:hypothetical protein
MTATAIPLITPVRAGSFSGQPTPLSLDYVETASGATGQTIPLNGLTLVTVDNTHANTKTFTVPSEPASPYGRTLPITSYSQATTIRSGFLVSNTPPGWRNADGTLHMTTGDTAQKIAAFAIPGIGAPWAGTSVTQGGRTPINPITPMGPYTGPQPGSATSWPIGAQPNALALDFVFSAMDNSNGNCIVMNGPLLLLFTDGGANTMTISSVPDALGRSGDITAYAVGSGLYSAIYVPVNGFRQTNGYLYLTASNAAVLVAAFACPA